MNCFINYRVCRIHINVTHLEDIETINPPDKTEAYCLHTRWPIQHNINNDIRHIKVHNITALIQTNCKCFTINTINANRQVYNTSRRHRQQGIRMCSMWRHLRLDLYALWHHLRLNLYALPAPSTVESRRVVRDRTFPESVCLADRHLPQPQRPVLAPTRVQLAVGRDTNHVYRPKVALERF